MEYTCALRTLFVLYLVSGIVILTHSTPISVAPAENADTGEQLSACQIFELPKYEGEFLHLENQQEIPNLLHLIESKWSNATKRHSVKLFGSCQLYGCTEERFSGLCKTFNATRKVVLQNRIVSVKCQCADKIITYKNEEPSDRDSRERESHDAKNESKTSNTNSDSFSVGCDQRIETFENFARVGKKIIGVARNYPWHRTSLASSVEPSMKPLIFLKPTTSFLLEGQPIRIPKDIGKIYYEVELGVVIGKRTERIPQESALDAVAGYFLALDLTAKDLLTDAISKGLPWEISKGFDTFTPVGPFIPRSRIPNPNNLQLTCKLNGHVKQYENTSQMMFNVTQLISYISSYMTLEPNDVILTGTPDGAGEMHAGDVIEGILGDEKLSKIQFLVI